MMPGQQSQLKCVSCNYQEADPNVKFCKYCGKPLTRITKAMHCPQCETPAGNANFCPQCGTKLIIEETAQQPPAGPKPVQAIPVAQPVQPAQPAPQFQQPPPHIQASPVPHQQPAYPQPTPQQPPPIEEEEEEPTCPECGEPLEEDDYDCPACGAFFDEEEGEWKTSRSLTEVLGSIFGGGEDDEEDEDDDEEEEEPRERFIMMVLSTHTSKEVHRLLKLYELPTGGSKKAKIDSLIDVMNHRNEFEDNHNYRKLISRVLGPIQRKQLWEICDVMGVDKSGDPLQILDRIKDNFAPAPRVDPSTINLQRILEILQRYNPLNFIREKDLEMDLFEELREHFGYEHVFRQVMTPYGKIDLHVGPMYGPGGIGIEIKLPASKTDIDRLQGQVVNFMRHYGLNLSVYFLAKDAILSQYVVGFQQWAYTQNIHVIRK